MAADAVRRSVLAGMLVAAFAMLAAGPALAVDRKAFPVDEAVKVPALAAARAALLEAVVARDLERVVAASAPDIELSFGGHAGHDDFRRFLTLSAADLADEYKSEADSRREAYWAALEEVLRMGGRFTEEGTFEAPYTAAVELGEDDDAFTTWFVIGARVPLRESPSPSGRVLALLDYDIVTIDLGGEDATFRKVKLARGATGYVESAMLRSPVGYRATFQKRGGRWLMIMFLAGD